MEVDRCEDLRPHYPRYVVGLADEHIVRRIELHRGEGCARCSAEIDRLEHAFHAVPLALPVEPLPDKSAEFLVQAVGRHAQDHVEVPILFPEPNQLRLWRLLALLSAVAVFCGALWGRGVQRELQRYERASAADRAQTQRVLGDFRAQRNEIAALQAVTRVTTNPTLPMADLRGDGRLRAWAELDEGRLTATIAGVAGGDVEVWWAPARGEAAALGSFPGGVAEGGGASQFELPDGASVPAMLSVRRGELVLLEGPIR